MDAHASLIQVSQSSVAIRAEERDFARLRQEFDAHHCIRLTGLLAEGLLTRLQDRAARSEFATRTLEHIGSQLVPVDPAVRIAGLLALTREALFRFLERGTGMAPLLGCDGTVQRLLPGVDQRLDWHADTGGGRMLGFTLGLDDVPDRGGRLQLRDRDSGRILHDAAPPAPATALFFRIGPSLEHRVTPVVSGRARTVLAGWFLRRRIPLARARSSA